MRNGSKYFFVLLSAAIVLLSGCYTQVMTPQEFIRAQRVQHSTPMDQKLADNSYSLNYNQSCVTCHSTIELNERAEELEYYGIRTVHDGFGLSNRQWNTEEATQISIITTQPNPYWPVPTVSVNSWWAPTTTTTVPSGNRPRTDGPTRDGNNERERSPSTPSVYSQPQTTAGSTTTPAPASTSVVTTPAPTQPAQSTESKRSRDDSSGNSSTGRTRSDGTSRDDDSNRPR